MNNIVLIIVLYNPTEEDVAQVVRLSERWPGYIVDNSDHRCFDTDQVNRMHYAFFGENMGLALAQNYGIKHLWEQPEVTHFVFLDQDSRVSVEYPQQIVEAFERISKDGNRLAVLGPTLVNRRTGEEYRSVIHRDRQVSPSFIPRREVVSSGCCISNDAFHHIGWMAGEMFIDYVDFEWCWRAATVNFICGITPELTIEHQVGRRELRIGKYRVIISAPKRYFYQYRNYLWLVQRPHTPRQWKVNTGIKMLARLFYFPLLVKGGWRCWPYMWKGIFKGLRSPYMGE